MERPFDHSLIEIRNNPFASTRSVAVTDGFYMKDLKCDQHTYIPSSEPHVEIGILDSLIKKIQEIEEEKSPQHIFIIGEYGQGKSFSIKKIQDRIYAEYNGGIISYPIGGNSTTLLDSIDDFQEKIMEDVETLFDRLDENLYLNKLKIVNKYQLSTQDKNLNQFLSAYDHAFSDLKILVYIFLDELDKIVISQAGDEAIRYFLEHLKLISDNCDKSISLIIAGTPNCLAKMNEISIDYSQRFERIEVNYLTKEKTVEYITEKCKSKLNYIGHHPFTRSVKNKIYKLTSGNIRRIEAICRELWNHSARTHMRIDLTILDSYLCTKLYEPVKNILVSSYNDNVIHFIIRLYLKGSRASVKSLEKGLSLTKLREIENFIQNTNQVTTLNRLYILNDDLKNQIDTI